eukprot:4056504-Amphidinium_carterae.1
MLLHCFGLGSSDKVVLPGCTKQLNTGMRFPDYVFNHHCKCSAPHSTLHSRVIASAIIASAVHLIRNFIHGSSQVRCT